jgi:hypothetical protein
MTQIAHDSNRAYVFEDYVWAVRAKSVVVLTAPSHVVNFHNRQPTTLVSGT